MQSITVCKQPRLRTFVQKRKTETHKIRLYGPFDILPGPKNLIKQDHISCTLIWHVQLEWRMGISDWNWSILHIWLVMKRYKWFTLFTFISKIKENRNIWCKFFKLEISWISQTLKSISENLMASWKNYFDNYIFLLAVRGGPWVWKVMMHGWTRMDNVYQSKSKDSGRDCEHHFQLSFVLPLFFCNITKKFKTSLHFVAPDFDWQRQPGWVCCPGDQAQRLLNKPQGAGPPCNIMWYFTTLDIIHMSLCLHITR